MKKKLILILILVAVVAIVAWYMLKGKKKEETGLVDLSGAGLNGVANNQVGPEVFGTPTIAAKYEGLYVYVPDGCTAGTSFAGGNDACTTWQVKGGKRYNWSATGISADRNVSGNVYEVRKEITLSDLMAIPKA